MNTLYSFRPPEPKETDLDLALKILDAVNDPIRTRANLEKLREATAAHRAAEARSVEALAEVSRRETALQKRFDAADEQIARQLAQHEKRMADERRAHDERLAGRERDLASREAKVEAADIEYQKRFADLERRMAILKQVGEFS
jgi:hypothetical protein